MIGELKGFQYAWFEAIAWNAHIISENDHYHYDNGYLPIFLEAVDCVTQRGYITRKLIHKFIEDGRQEAVKVGIGFLIEELSKGESKRNIQ